MKSKKQIRNAIDTYTDMIDYYEHQATLSDKEKTLKISETKARIEALEWVLEEPLS
jgi:hypothetical protein